MLIYIGIILFGFVTILILAQRAYHRVYHNLGVAAKILNTTIEDHFFTKSVKGSYKGRDVIFRWILGDGRGFSMRLKMVHRAGPQKIKLVSVDYPKPTKNTWLLGEVVQYRILWGTYSEQEFIAMVDELSQAAEIVEQGSAFYSK